MARGIWPDSMLTLCHCIKGATPRVYWDAAESLRHCITRGKPRSPQTSYGAMWQQTCGRSFSRQCRVFVLTRCMCWAACNPPVPPCRRLRTRFIEGTHNPVWDERFEVYLADEADTIKLTVKVLQMHTHSTAEGRRLSVSDTVTVI